jgi:ABC-type sugar transport system permease subunit
MTVWRFTGYYTVLVLSGLQNIPHEIEEAARIDGAGELRLAWSVVLPLLSPTLLSTVVECIRSLGQVPDVGNHIADFSVLEL